MMSKNGEIHQRQQNPWAWGNVVIYEAKSDFGF